MRFSARPQAGIRHGDRRMRRHGARQGPADLGRADRREGRRRTVTLPLEMAREGAQGRELAHQGAALHEGHAPRREEGADVEGLEGEDRRHVRRSAEMAGQKTQELPQIPPVGLDGVRGQAPLAGEPAEPCRRLAAGILGRGHHRVETLEGAAVLLMFLLCADACPILGQDTLTSLMSRPAPWYEFTTHDSGRRHPHPAGPRHRLQLRGARRPRPQGGRRRPGAARRPARSWGWCGPCARERGRISSP